MAQRRPILHRVLDYSDEGYAALMLLLELHSLKTTGLFCLQFLFPLSAIDVAVRFYVSKLVPKFLVQSWLQTLLFLNRCMGCDGPQRKYQQQTLFHCKKLHRQVHRDRGPWLANRGPSHCCSWYVSYIPYFNLCSSEMGTKHWGLQHHTPSYCRWNFSDGRVHVNNREYSFLKWLG